MSEDNERLNAAIQAIGVTAADITEAWERALRSFSWNQAASDDPGLSPDAARWTPEDDK